MALKDQITGREYEKFKETPSGFTAINTITTPDDIRLYRTEVSGNKTFYGWATDLTATTASASWLIKRVTTTSTATTTEWALSGTYTAVWDDRATYFVVGGFVNTLSTSFDGINQSVSFGNVFNYDVANQWSISVWSKPNNLAIRHTVYSKTTTDANVYGWGFYHLETSGVPFVQIRAPGFLGSYTGTLPVAAGVWNHVVFTYNGAANVNGLRVYVNNVVDTTPASFPLGASLLSGQTAMIGRRNAAVPMSGRLNTATIWNKALTATEVSSLYNGGSPDDPTLLSFYSDAESYYTLGDGDTYPTILDNKSANTGIMNNMSAANFVSDAP